MQSELRRGAARALVPSLVTSAKSGDYSAAVYAARLANELVNLEKTRNKVYTDFIYSGFSSSEVPLGLPSDLQKLSRTSPATVDASPVGETSTTSSSGSSPDAGLDFLLPGARGRPARPIQDPFTKASGEPSPL
nr:uncharacterized protein LOC123763755 [Procambarus clarkii]